MEAVCIRIRTRMQVRGAYWGCHSPRPASSLWWNWCPGSARTSLALISDAGHNATDALALALAWFAVYLQCKPADESRTFGYHRAGVLAAFVNAIVLMGLTAWMVYESCTG